MATAEDYDIDHLTKRVELNKYEDGHSVDWLSAPYITLPQRRHLSLAQYKERILDGIRTWFVVILTGAGIGLAGAWLDVLVKWSVHFGTRSSSL